MELPVKWYDNIVFWSGFTAWFVAQSVKFLETLVRTRRVDFRSLVSTGGMPSAHSCMVSALATAVALTEGLHSPIFAVTAGLAVVVMFDAQTVRRAAGMQARLLNQVMSDLFKTRHFPHQKLKELLGHTPLQVYAGMFMGILTALILHCFWNVQETP